MRRFLQIARGSANEVEHHLLLARDLRFLNAAEFEELETGILEIQRMLTSLAASVSEAIA